MNDVKKYYLQKSKQFGWGHSGEINEERKKILDKWVIGERVLDIGCAVGNYVNFLYEKGLKAVGVDYVSEFIKQARKTRKGTFVHADAASLPFENSSYDTVILFDILEHMEDDKKVLKEAVRVAKRRLIAIVPKECEREMEESGLVYRHFMDRTHLRVYSREELQNLFEGCKLHILEIKGIDPLPLVHFAIEMIKPSFINRLIRKLIINRKELWTKDYFSEYLIVADK